MIIGKLLKGKAAKLSSERFFENILPAYNPDLERKSKCSNAFPLLHFFQLKFLQSMVTSTLN